MAKVLTTDYLRRITGLTKQGKLHWEETPNDDEFRAEIGPGVVLVRPNAVFDEENSRSVRGYLAFLTDSQLRIVEEVRSLEWDSEFDALDALYAEARRTARDGDALADEVIAALGRLAEA